MKTPLTTDITVAKICDGFVYNQLEGKGLFGLGGKLATFAALLHMLVHSLVKSSIFFTVGHASHMHGTQQMDRIQGLIRGNPLVGWGLVVGVMAIAGLPPFGVFVSEFLILTATMREAPFLAPILLLGLAVAFAGLLRKVQPMVFGAPSAHQVPVRAAHVPVLLHLALALVLGLFIPSFLSQWFETAVSMMRW